MRIQDSIKNQLVELKPGIAKRFFVNKIGLFGSVMRNDFGDNSDIDIIVDFYKPVGIEFIDLADFLEEKLHRKVHLVSLNGIKKHYFELIKNRIVYV
jgi:predicted nucleotidyltransferase